MSKPRAPDFHGFESYQGEWHQASSWPAHKVDLEDKRIAVIGTGSTGVQLVPELAQVAREVVVYQRTPNYVLPGRNHAMDEREALGIKKNHAATWQRAVSNIGGHALNNTNGRTIKGTAAASDIRQVFDQGWERGNFPFQYETFDDVFTDPSANELAAEFIRQKIRAIVRNPATAELLCPKYTLGAKRSPSGNFYYEAFNQPSVSLVDVSQDDIVFYEKGIRTAGTEREFDVVVFALGFDTGIGALIDMDIRGVQGQSIKACWDEKLATFAGALVSGFPNMFIILGPQSPIGNLPVPLDILGDWVGKTIRHMEEKGLASIDVKEEAQKAWADLTDGIWNSHWLGEPAKETRSWFVGANIPGRPPRILYYFGGVPSWRAWLDEEVNTSWARMNFTSHLATAGADRSADVGGVAITADELESLAVPLQSDQAGMSPEEKFNLGSAISARYIDWAVKEMHERRLAVKQDYRVHWWRVLQQFVKSESGQALLQRCPNTREELDRLTSTMGVEGEAIGRIGPELVRLLTGQTNPLFHVLRGELLFRMYLSDEGARPNRYVAEYAKRLVSRRKNIRILEVGAGTGGTTFQVLQACSPRGERFCSEYMYTDVSNGFFKTGGSTLKKWNHLLTFKTLNVESDAAKQGFEEHAYDLIIAANVIHATRSVAESLGTVRKLLKPGGVLGLVELTTLTPYFNIAFGSLSGWWLGVDEGRTESPLQSAEQWGGHLQRAGFSGVDLVAYDFPEPERHSALLLSTAV